MLERDISAKIVKYLRSKGCLVYKLTTFGPYGQRGWPDLLVVPKGCAPLFIEVKRPGEDLKAHQKRRVGKLRDQGQKVFVADSVDEVKELGL